MDLCQLFDRTFDLMLGVICLSEETLAVSDDPPVDSEPEPGPKLFRRPSGILSSQINRMLPPGPPDQIELEFGNFHKKLHALDYLRSFGMLAVFLGLMAFQVWLWRGFVWSPLVAGLYLIILLGEGLVYVLGPRLVTDIGEVGLAIFALVIVLGLLRIIVRKLVLFVIRRRERKRAKKAQLQNGEEVTPPAKPERKSRLSVAAVREEQWFREGAENWNKRQRLVSCAGFALVHMGNIIYPIATLLPLGIMGYVFMRAYLGEYKVTGDRTKAVLRSSKLHRMYNRVAFWAAAIQLTALFGFHISIFGH